MKLGDEAPSEPDPAPATDPRRSVKADHIVYLECAGKFKSLKRHIGTAHGLTPQEYREKWKLARDYPMVAPAYAQERSRLGKQTGLGRKAAGRPRKAQKAGKAA